jgi:DNA-binding SARP family transcriptional activator/tetratricopeptide (TPR) repeat protein
MVDWKVQVTIGFRVLGPVEILDGGRPQGATTAQQRAVLAMLLLDLGRVVPVGRLISALWATEPPASARNAVRVHVTKLRGLVAADPSVAITTVGEGWRLTCDPDRVDLYRFRDLVERARSGPTADAGALLRAGLSEWRGPALADVTGHWLAGTVVEGLEDERLAATEDRIAFDLRSGAPQAVIPELSVLAAEHPLRERPAQLLMAALHGSGRTAEGLEVFQRTRRHLVEELGIEPSTVLQREHRRLLDGAGGEAKTVAPLPRQLPGDVAAFAGRAEQLAHLDGLLEKPGPLVATVAGIPGAGKTSLAVHWAHRVKDRFPDGQLYLNLRGFEPTGEAVDPADAVLRFLDALEVPADRIPAEADARSALYRSVLADRRMLIVLDNARDEAQVRPLLPGADGCATVVTGRTQLAGLVIHYGAHLLTLDVLDAAEARDLLAGRIGAARVEEEPEAAARIVERCAGLPLSLAMVAARAAVQPDFPLAFLAAELESETGLDAFESPDAAMDLRSVFSWSYRQLSPGAARMFRLLGLHWGPGFAAEAAASLAGVPAATATRWLRELRRMQLVAEHAPGRFDLHDLLAAYAAELTEALDAPEDRSAATRRLLDHYLHTARAAERILAPHRSAIGLPDPVPGALVLAPESHARASAWFEAERPALVSAVDAAYRRGCDRHTWQLARQLATHLRRTGLGTAWLATQRLAVAAADRSGDVQAMALAHHGLAAAQIRFGDHAEAEANLLEALRHFETLEDLDGQANVHSVRCLISEAAGDFTTTLAYAERSLALFRAAGNRHGQVRALNNVGYSHAELGAHDLAVASFLEALDLSRELGDPDGRATTLDSLGFTYARLGEHAKAIESYRCAAELLDRSGERFRAAAARHRLGDAHLAAGDRGAASEAWRSALAAFDDLGHRQAETVRAKLTAMQQG